MRSPNRGQSTVEKTSVSDIKSFQQQKLNTCSGGSGDDPIDLVTTGNTELRYDATDKQFIQN